MQRPSNGNLHPHDALSPSMRQVMPRAAVVRPTLPDRNVTAATLEDAYTRFILYCNPAVPLEIDTAALKEAFRTPPKSGGKSFSTFTLFELIKQLEAKELKTWAELALKLGVEPPDQEKGQSSQKIQQYAVRLKRWMHSMHVDAFFDYLLDIQHPYWMQIPTDPSPVCEAGRDGVAAEDDMALRALLPHIRPKRGRRKPEDDDLNKSPSQRPRLESRAAGDEFRPDGIDPWSAHPDGRNPFFFADASRLGTGPVPPAWPSSDLAQTPISAYPQSAITPATNRGFWGDEPRSAITPGKPKLIGRRHGAKVVSSAWRSGSGGTGKARGRPPINRATNGASSEGPFSAFPTTETPTAKPSPPQGSGVPVAPMTSQNAPVRSPSIPQVPAAPATSVPQSNMSSNMPTSMPTQQSPQIFIETSTMPTSNPPSAAVLTPPPTRPLSQQIPPKPQPPPQPQPQAQSTPRPQAQAQPAQPVQPSRPVNRPQNPPPRPVKPSRLSLQVPERPTGSVRLATPPPVVVVNGQTPAANRQPPSQQPAQPRLTHSQPPQLIGVGHFVHAQPVLTKSYASSVTSATPASSFAPSTATPLTTVSSEFTGTTTDVPPPPLQPHPFFEDPSDRTNMEEIECFFMESILGANWFGPDGKETVPCTLAEAKAIVDTVVGSLVRASSTEEAFLINLAALAGAKMLMTSTGTSVHRTAVLEGEAAGEEGDRTQYVFRWELRYGSMRGTFEMRETVPHERWNEKTTEGQQDGEATNEGSEIDWEKKYRELMAVVKKKDQQLEGMRTKVMGSLKETREPDM